MKTKIYFSMLIILASVKWSCKPETVPDDADSIFPIYIAKDVEVKPGGIFKTVPVIDYYAKVDKDISLEHKITILLQQLSKTYFNDLVIEIKEIRKTEPFSTLYINLTEKPEYQGPGTVEPYQSWYDYFQGSSGGTNTRIILTESILQKHYKGNWIDALVVFYQGDPFGEYDHIDLRGTIFRYE